MSIFWPPSLSLPRRQSFVNSISQCRVRVTCVYWFSIIYERSLSHHSVKNAFAASMFKKAVAKNPTPPSSVNHSLLLLLLPLEQSVKSHVLSSKVIPQVREKWTTSKFKIPSRAFQFTYIRIFCPPLGLGQQMWTYSPTRLSFQNLGTFRYCAEYENFPPPSRVFCINGSREDLILLTKAMGHRRSHVMWMLSV